MFEIRSSKGSPTTNITQKPQLGMEVNVKRRRGGLQQRLDEEQRSCTRSSKLANHLLNQYAWGKISVQEVQKFAMLALQDLTEVTEGSSTVIFPDLIRLSKLGSSGQHRNNMSRDIENYIESMNDLPKATMVDLPTKKGNELTGIMLPHEIFSYLYEKYPKAFYKLFMPCLGLVCCPYRYQLKKGFCGYGLPTHLNSKKALKELFIVSWPFYNGH